MITDPDIREQAYQYFLEEAPSLLETIEQELLNLNNDLEISERRLKVNELMRSAHTLKGGAANVGLETIKTVAHSLEDLLKALYNPELDIDVELQNLLFESYECLRMPLMAELSQAAIDHSQILDQAANVFARLQDRLGDYLSGQDAFPTSEELGIDVVESFFQEVVPERIEEINAAIDSGEATAVTEVLSSHAEIFQGLAESLNLPGFGAIASTILTALQQQPQQAIEIAKVAKANLEQAKEQVMGGDRALGGKPSAALLELAGMSAPTEVETVELDNSTAEVEVVSFDESDTEALFDANGAEDIFSIEPESDSNAFIDGEINSDLAEAEEMFALSESDSNKTSEGEIMQEIWGEAEDGANTIEPEFRDDDITVVEFEPVSPTKLNQAEVVETKPVPATSSVNEKIVVADRSDIKPKTPTKPTRSNNDKTKAKEKNIRVNLNSLEKLNDVMGELLINQNQNVLKDEQIHQSVQELLVRLKQNEQILGRLSEIFEEIETDPQSNGLSSEKLNLMAKKLAEGATTEEQQQVSQLIKSAIHGTANSIQTAENIKNYNQSASRNLNRQQRMLLNMRDELINTRMSPIGKVFNRFPYLAERLSNGGYNKKLELKLSGSHILIDKAIEDKLYDPLLHLVRNAFDHGLETTQERIAAGKPEAGTIEMRAYYQGSQTIIEVKDDGGGINLEKVKNRAIENKLVDAETATNLSPNQILEFLFESGFSTAAKISDLSGRGVGLDVVKSQIEAMNGTINIETAIGEGTTFSLQIPLTLSIAKLMLCETDGIVYALLTDAIEKILQPDSKQLKMFDGQKVLHWQIESESTIVPIRKLSSLMHYTRTPQNQLRNASNPTQQRNSILLLRRGKELLGLEVDCIIGEQELVIRPLGSAIVSPSYIYGCSILSNTRLTLVVDAAALIKEMQTEIELASERCRNELRCGMHPRMPRRIEFAEDRGQNFESSPQSAYIEGQQPEAIEASADRPLLTGSSFSDKTLMVIDDSSSLRRTIGLTLEKISDQVLRAENGFKGLEQLQKHKNIELIVCDLEMPQMNGFQFLKAKRQNPRFADIPVIILTTRDSDKHRRQALELGAAAYLTKPYGEEELLNTVTGLLVSKS